MRDSDQVVWWLKEEGPAHRRRAFSVSCFLSISRIPNGAKLICTGFEFAKWFGMRIVDGFCTGGRG
jgi:hypothetical protein